MISDNDNLKSVIMKCLFRPKSDRLEVLKRKMIFGF